MDAKCFWIIALFVFLLAGCDGSLDVTGKIGLSKEAEPVECMVSLWSKRGPFWKEPTPQIDREAKVNETIDIHWTISGPARNRWIEIDCPGYVLYRSDEFEAPSTEPHIDLGAVNVEKTD